jgi:hypothetical protein
MTKAVPVLMAGSSTSVCQSGVASIET